MTKLPELRLYRFHCATKLAQQIWKIKTKSSIGWEQHKKAFDFWYEAEKWNPNGWVIVGQSKGGLWLWSWPEERKAKRTNTLHWNVNITLKPFLAVHNSLIGLIVRPSLCLLPLTIRVFTTLQSDPRDLWPLKHLISIHPKRRFSRLQNSADNLNFLQKDCRTTRKLSR